MNTDLIIEKIEKLMIMHGMKCVIINGYKNYIIGKDLFKSPHYLRLCRWDNGIQIESALSYNEALLGVYEDTEGVAIPVSMLQPEEVEKLGFDYISKYNYSEYDFYSIFQMYIIEFYKNNCLIDKLESLGFKRVVKDGRVINVKDDVICDISYDFNISAIVCKIASKRRSLIREYDYEQGFYLCESVLSDLEGFMKE